MRETVAFTADESTIHNRLRTPVLDRIIRTARRGKTKTSFARCIVGLAAACTDSEPGDSHLREQVLSEYRDWRRRQHRPYHNSQLQSAQAELSHPL